MVNNLNVIMKYNRTKPVWVCPDCDTENDLNNETCFTCDRPKTNMARIITPESEKRDMEESVTIRRDTPQAYYTPPTPISSPVSKPTYYSDLSDPVKDFSYPSSGGSKTGLVLAIIIVIVAICTAVGFIVTASAKELPENAVTETVTDMTYFENTDNVINDNI